MHSVRLLNTYLDSLGRGSNTLRKIQPQEPHLGVVSCTEAGSGQRPLFFHWGSA